MANPGYIPPISSNLFWYGLAPGQVVIPSKVNYYNTFYEVGPDPDKGSPRTIPPSQTVTSTPPQAYGAGSSLLNTIIPNTPGRLALNLILLGAVVIGVAYLAKKYGGK